MKWDPASLLYDKNFLGILSKSKPLGNACALCSNSKEKLTIDDSGLVYAVQFRTRGRKTLEIGIINFLVPLVTRKKTQSSTWNRIFSPMIK